MKYRFNVPDKKIPAHIDEGLIPVAIARAKLVKPDPSIQSEWEKAIFKDLERPDPKFSFFNFVRGLLP